MEPTFRNVAESRVFDYLRRPFDRAIIKAFTIRKRETSVWVTVNFNMPSSDFGRWPTASTCVMMVCIPTTYESFAKEFTEITCSLLFGL